MYIITNIIAAGFRPVEEKSTSVYFAGEDYHNVNFATKIGGQVKATISCQELKTRFLRYFAHKQPLPKIKTWCSYFPPEALSFS